MLHWQARALCFAVVPFVHDECGISILPQERERFRVPVHIFGKHGIQSKKDKVKTHSKKKKQGIRITM